MGLTEIEVEKAFLLSELNQLAVDLAQRYPRREHTKAAFTDKMNRLGYLLIQEGELTLAKYLDNTDAYD